MVEGLGGVPEEEVVVKVKACHDLSLVATQAAQEDPP
jgi:hypothetical protein